MPSVLWLENKLRGYKGSFLLVTHDRTLLENVVTSVISIEDLLLDYYPCDFKEFQKRKEDKDKARDKMIDTFLKRNTNLNPMSPIYKTMLKYREWQDKRRARDMLLQGKFTFTPPKPLPGPEGPLQKEISLINIENVRFSYDEAKDLPFIFDNPISYNVKYGTRVGIMGPNGAGKSTFLKLITGKLTPTSGTIKTNKDFTLAYFGQHSTKELDLKDTPFEFMTASFPKEKEGVLKNHLKKTSIGDDPMNTRMGNLSFSQRSCVIFAKLTFVPPHLLIMDEPTNFLDIDSIDSLIGAANKFSGALITVTHNRDFLKRCSKHYLSIVPGAFLEFKTMKEAERATYSFISDLEAGRTVDAKTAIAENRGGGAIHTEESLGATKLKLDAQQAAAQAEADAIQFEVDRLAELALEKEVKRKAKVAAQKVDWVAGDKCWAPVKNAFQPATVVRNVPAMVI
jgi:ATP-binding cassette subfamily F protein 3